MEWLHRQCRDRTKKIGGLCTTQKRNAQKIVVGKPEGQRQLGRLRHTQENMKIKLK
jgi:hypothetical protein